MVTEPIDVLKALSDFGRLRVLKSLERKSLCVCEITELIGLATSTVSSHLTVLKNAGLIVDEKQGKWINYRMLPSPAPFFLEIWPIISKHLDDNPVIQQDLRKVASVDRKKICSNA